MTEVSASALGVWRTRLAREATSLRGGIDLRFALCHLIARLLPNYMLCSARAWLYRAGGCDIASGVAVQGALHLLGSGAIAPHLHIASGAIVAPLCVFGLDADISIGRNASIGPGTTFHTATHDIGFASRRMQLALEAHPIVVEEGVWIGARALVLPGLTIGRGSVVAAGAVVMDDVLPNVFASGNPAQPRESLPFANR